MAKTNIDLTNIAELFGGEPIPEDTQEETKEYKTVGKLDIVTTVSYMIGLKDNMLDTFYGDEYGELLAKLRESKEATIIRYLSILRTTLMQNFLKTDTEIRYNLGNIDRMGWFDGKAIKQLVKWSVPVVQSNMVADKYTEHFCYLIGEHIDACEKLFPEWVKFEYIKDLFVVPRYNRGNTLKSEFDKYQANIKFYPFQMYIHWEPGDYGNMLISDGKFLSVIYEQHKDHFSDKSKVHDAVDSTKESIYDFLRRSRRAVVVVDCENSDVYKLYGVLKNLDTDELEKIEKIILYDDYHTSCGWDWLEKFIKIPVKHIEVERVTDQKSLVDIKMTAGVCEAFYRDNIDSFILCSSDSDFWGLISSLPDAEFLVMYEYSKCGQAIKEALDTRRIFHCSIDDFYTGNAADLQKKVLLHELKKYSGQLIGKNAWDLTKELYLQTRITETEGNMKLFYNKYVKTARLTLDETGAFAIVIAD